MPRCARILVCLLFLLFSNAPGQGVEDYAVHANIVYRFTKYIDWPVEKKAGDFEIGVIGNHLLYQELSKFTTNKTVGNQRLLVYEVAENAKSYDCQILFVGANAGKHVPRIAALTANQPVLLVSEGYKLAQKGACINFSITDEHLKLELNKKNIETRKLNIASELVSLCVAVR